MTKPSIEQVSESRCFEGRQLVYKHASSTCACTMRFAVFLPPAAEAWEVSGSWQHRATAAVLLAWAVAALVVGVRTFRWQRRDDG